MSMMTTAVHFTSHRTPDVALTLPHPECVAREFRARDVIVLRGVMSTAWVAHLREVARRNQAEERRRDFRMMQTGGSPRRLHVIGGTAMERERAVMGVYRAPALLAWLEALSGAPATTCPNELEHVIMVRLSRCDDEHGWHVDDYPFAFVSVVDGPSPGCGGHVEMDRGAGCVEHVVLRSGDVYLMRADRMRHRVAPLTTDGRRLILNFTYSISGTRVELDGSADVLCG